MSEGAASTIILVSNDNAEITVGKLPRLPIHCDICRPPAESNATRLTSTIDRAVAERSMLIKNMLDDLGDGILSTPVPIPNVSPHL